jgi:hypothetical protein
MKKLIIIGLISILPIWLVQSGCEDFFERDLSGSVIDMAVPSDSATVIGPIVDFWWETVSSCSGYEFQIISLDFNKPVLVLADTAVVSNSIRLNLPPGVYHWRVRAYNQSSVTSFTLQTLFIAWPK